jgi:hypothetical protein
MVDISHGFKLKDYYEVIKQPMDLQTLLKVCEHIKKIFTCNMSGVKGEM